MSALTIAPKDALGNRSDTAEHGHAFQQPGAAPSNADSYLLAIPLGAQRRLARAWLWLAIGALIGSGLFSLLLVQARTPMVNRWLSDADFFRVALVVHVDLSVLVWFVSMAGMLWTIAGSGRGMAWGWLALGLCATGASLMALAAFVGDGAAIMANYIPVLDRPLFLAGLALFASGACALVLRSLLTARKFGPALGGEAVLRFGLNAAAVAAAVALLAFAWSFAVLPATLAGKTYYELLFWGGGHALQFGWTLLMLVAWIWLSSACGARLHLRPRVALLLFAVALASVFVTPFAYLAHPVTSVEHRELLTWAMRLGGGVAIFPVALAVVLALCSAPGCAARMPVLRAALFWSIVLFSAGGLIGAFINGANVRIPAHYHGCIVGVTLALMGLAYHLLPQLGYAAPRGRVAALQPGVYGAGQLMHITGLVWSGGYGVQRKVAGVEQVLGSSGEIAGMALMGLGGGVAIVGGLLFVVVLIRAMRRPAVAASMPQITHRA